MHEGLKVYTGIICDRLSSGLNLKFFSRDKYQVEDEGHKTIAYFEDQTTGTRYTLTLTVHKTARVETALQPDEEGQKTESRSGDLFDLDAHPVPNRTMLSHKEMAAELGLTEEQFEEALSIQDAEGGSLKTIATRFQDPYPQDERVGTD